MANYAPTTWATGDTISATKLNNIENGLNNLTIAGTANQVLVNGATTAVNNAAITLTLPQSIATGSSPTFAKITSSFSDTTAFNGGAGVQADYKDSAGLTLQNTAATAGTTDRFSVVSCWSGEGNENGRMGFIHSDVSNNKADFFVWTFSAGTVLRVTDAGNIVPGSAALATTATDGFTYIQTCAGAPTGVPTAYTGRIAMVFDTTNNNLYVYDGGWLKVAMAA